MKTFKVTFFEGFEVLKVETFHNVTDQDAFCKLLANYVVTLGLSPILKVEDSEGVDYTKTTNYFVSNDIYDLDPDYIRRYLDRTFGVDL